ncbi:MAG: tail fiber domain-containing protein [Saprospiraceae bacterium]|nr:tail fiber domain-containing protein [Saprospiraceae bacterium]
MKKHTILFACLFSFVEIAISQNIGINTPSPAGKLHIKGSADVSQLIIDANSTQSNTSPLFKLRNSQGTDLLWMHSDTALNTFIGIYAGHVNNANGGGIFNTYTGSHAGFSSSTGNSNSGFGANSLFLNGTGSFNSAHGLNALFSNASGSWNTAIGANALFASTTGSSNTAIGNAALLSNTFGLSNTAIGVDALKDNVSGSNNTAIGFNANVSAGTLINATAIGSRALARMDNSVVIGSINGVNGATAGANVGIGTSEPTNKLHVVGNLLVNESYISTNTAPTPAQTQTLVNNATLSFPGSDSTGRIFDTGGPSGNYINNIIANASINISSGSIGFEVLLENVELGTGDSLIIRATSSPTSDVFLRIGNGYSSTGKWVFNSNTLYVIFKSNSDSNNGSGFSLLFKRLFSNTANQNNLTGNSGKSFFFDSQSGALRSGFSNNNPRGLYSFASGYRNTASGQYSAAIGNLTVASGQASTALGYFNSASGQYSAAIGTSTVASGQASTALGYFTSASGNHSTAMGNGTSASGQSSTAMGNNTIASGLAATSIGYNTTANGNFSTAMGNYVSTSFWDGAFALGDNSTTTVMESFVANGFRSRFAGGYRLFSNSATTLGVRLLPDDSAWSAISDARLKENFLSIDGEQMLRKIAGMPLTTWNYIAQTNKTSRHYGPMAQDFFSAFGKDELGTIGCDTLINQQDFLGINLIAIQALEKRTSLIEALNEENTLLKAKVTSLHSAMDNLINRLTQLESLVANLSKDEYPHVKSVKQ